MTDNHSTAVAFLDCHVIAVDTVDKSLIELIYSSVSLCPQSTYSLVPVIFWITCPDWPATRAVRGPSRGRAATKWQHASRKTSLYSHICILILIVYNFFAGSSNSNRETCTAWMSRTMIVHKIPYRLVCKILLLARRTRPKARCATHSA